MEIDANKLDNPVWNSLNEVHSEFSIEYDGAKFYKPEYCPFGGFISFENSNGCIDKYAAKARTFYIVGDMPKYNGKLTLKRNLICNQMILKAPIDIKTREQIIELKSNSHKRDLFNLVNLIQPGYFNNQTSDLGRYYGIFKNNNLIAVTGERMKMNKFTEVSAVITHPEHSGKGYAKQLIKYTTDQIFEASKTPYLHVAESNIGAIKLYEKLGFTTRRKMSFRNLVKS